MPTATTVILGGTEVVLAEAPASGLIQVWGISISAGGVGDDPCDLFLASGEDTVKWQARSNTDVNTTLSVLATKEPLFSCEPEEELRLIAEGDGTGSVFVQYVVTG